MDDVMEMRRWLVDSGTCREECVVEYTEFRVLGEIEDAFPGGLNGFEVARVVANASEWELSW